MTTVTDDRWMTSTLAMILEHFEDTSRTTDATVAKGDRWQSRRTCRSFVSRRDLLPAF
jgi:hypothetical protein